MQDLVPIWKSWWESTGYVQGEGKKPKFIYKTLCMYSYMLQLQSTVYFMQHIYRDFFPLLRNVFELVDFDAF